MNEKYLSDEFQNEIVEKLSNEIASIIVKRVESAINNADGFKDKRVVNLPITCTPSDDECEKCPLKFNCNKAQIKEEDRN